jgi:hypothetical protein
LSGTEDSEAGTEEIRVTPGTRMVLTPPAPSSVVEVIWGGGDEDADNDLEVGLGETEDGGTEEPENERTLLSLVVEDGVGTVDGELLDSGTPLLLEVEVGSTTGRGPAPTTGPSDPCGRGARFLIIARFML